MIDDKLSIAELQRMASGDPAFAPYDARVALRNAAPVLLEIAAAALAWARSECETQSIETDDYTVAERSNECAGDTHSERCPVDIAVRNLAAALAKVRP